MRKILVLFAALSVFSSCATYNTLVYEGLVKYYLPDGEVEIYDATYTETYFNGIKSNDQLSVDIGSGNVFLYRDIPYSFKGHLAFADNGAKRGEHDTIVIDDNGNYILFFDGEKHVIPADVYNRLKYQSNGDPDKLKKSLIEYLQKE